MFYLLKLCIVGVILCICCSSLSTSGVVAAEPELIFTHILHRHGARMPSAKSGKAPFCNAAPCEQLTKNGAIMMTTIGKFFSDRYTRSPNLLFTAPDKHLKSPPTNAEMMPQYSTKHVYSRSTDVDRTIQSAVAFLLGFFGPGKSFVPAVHTVPQSMDTLLLTYLQPNIGFYYRYYRDPLIEEVKKVTDKLFTSPKTLMYIASEINLTKSCDENADQTECAFVLYDIATSMESEGLIDKYPVLKQNYENIKAVYRELLRYESYFNQTDKERQLQGSRGYIFWKQVLKNIEDKINGKIDYKMIHYSGHDITLTPISGSLFDQSAYGMLPPYGQTLAIELLRVGGVSSKMITSNGGTNVSHSSSTKNGTPEVKYYVRVLRGNPGQKPEDLTVFQLEDPKNGLQLKCMDSTGKLYDAQGNTCPLGDFKRMLEAGAPTDPRGSCLLEKKLEKVVDCPKNPTLGLSLENASQNVSVPKVCAQYRKQCPEVACMGENNTNYMLDLKTLLCVDNRIVRVERKWVLGSAVIAVISVILFFIGFVVALILGIRCLREKEDNTKEKPV